MEKKEEDPVSTLPEAEIIGIKFSVANFKEIDLSSVSDSSISHASQLTNPFLGLPLEFGKCESCGTSEPGKCDGHFGHIELPTPIYHPSHVSELKRLLSLLCLKCLKTRKTKFPGKSSGIAERLLASCCEDSPQLSVKEVKTNEGAMYLELKASRSKVHEGFWNFLNRYGFRYGYGITRSVLPSEVMEILKKIPQDTERKLSAKGHFSQEGYIIKKLPVPPNCLSVPDVSDGERVMSADPSMAMLKKILRQCEIIRSSRSGTPNFESHEVEANELQTVVRQYIEVRGTSKASNDVGKRFGISKDPGDSSTKAWLRKMKTLFISKGSGFSSRCVITGDSYKRVNEIGIPFEVAQGITFEERVNMHNIKRLQELVDNKLCLTYRDGSTTYSLREGSKGHTFLRHGQVVHRRIMDGDTVFVNRPPTTHKHSLQALSVYIHDDCTVKINPLICSPLGADFDGDSIHIFYPQSPAAKAEVLELFSVEKQLLSSHNGNLNLQLATDSMLSLKLLFKSYFLDRAAAQQLSMFVSSPLPPPAVLKARPCWTTLQILQTALPAHFDCDGEKYSISDSVILNVDFTKEVLQSVINEIVHSIFFEKGPAAVLKFFDSLQPMLMEHLVSEGFSVSLEDFYISRAVVDYIHQDIKVISPLLGGLRSTYNERAEMQLESHIYHAKLPVANFIVKSSGLGVLIDSKSDSAVDKVVQQIGFLGLQLFDRGKFYSKTLVEDIACHFDSKYYDKVDYPSLRHGLIKNCFISGLDPIESMIHSISAREAMVRSSRGLAEPGTLFKNLMAILRDVVICYDGTVRNVSSNSIIQFEYGTKAGTKSQSQFPAGEPVGVLAATAISNPAYKAVLDSTPKSTSTWELMKEVLLCRVNFKNDLTDRRVIFYLNDCSRGRKYCRENAAMLIKNHLKKASLRDATVEFMIEYKNQEIQEGQSGLAGHLHLNKAMLEESTISMQDVLQKCQEKLSTFQKKKKNGNIFKKISLYTSECCSFHHSGEDKSSDPCLMFLWQDINDGHLERASDILADWICPVLLDTIIKEASSWIRNPSTNRKGELAVDIVIDKQFVKESGDAWRVALNSCLPLLHLIDTTHSIPYAIKQGQELLGISSSFNQAVQRLSTSIRSVARGILKEHLVLLANSMTSAGTLIGFTTGGFKAFTRLLNIQVPITEATHSTPKKCFERAAEKCHLDSLKSVVASCAWGKHVALGTGTRFDIFLDKKVDFKQEAKMDVYDFLHMVRSTKKDKSNTGCLGEELDELDFDEDNMDWNLSPEHNGPDKPVFEDIVEVEPSKVQTEAAGGWDAFSNKAENETSGGWGAAAASTRWGSKPEKTTEENGSAWGSKPEQNAAVSNAWGSGKAVSKGQEENEKFSGWAASSGGGWGSKTEQPSGSKTGTQKEQSGGWGSKSEQTVKSNAWGAKKQDSAQESEKADDGWGTGGGGGWGAKSEQTPQPSAWGAKKPQESEKADSLATGGGGWGSKPQQTANSNGWGAKKQPEEAKKSDSLATGGWGSKLELPAKSNAWGAKKQPEESEKADDGWGTGGGGGLGGKSEQTAQPSVWGANKQPESEKADSFATGGGGWGSKPEQTGKSNAWGAKKQPEEGENPDSFATGGGGWESKPEQTAKSNAWGAKKQPEESDKADDTWAAGGGGGGWGAKSEQTSQPSVWGAKKQPESEKADTLAAGGGGWGSKPEQTPNSNAWGAKKQPEENEKADDSGWGSKSDQTGKSNAWGAAKQDPAAKSHDENNGWGLPTDSWGGAGGWGSNSQENTPKSSTWGNKNAGDWKNKNRPPRPPGAMRNDYNTPGLYTATRQRLDLFTSDEQDILLTLEPLMLSLRKIMQNSVYSDGEPLSAEDQSFIMDNVFNYHPEKELKMGAGIDHFVANKHTTFQESRCLYAVSTDGLKQDFSYRKCLENFIRGKYPNFADEFVPKYFAKPQPRQPREGQGQGQGRKREREETTREQKENTDTAPAATNTEEENTGTVPAATDTEEQKETGGTDEVTDK